MSAERHEIRILGEEFRALALVKVRRRRTKHGSAHHAMLRIEERFPGIELVRREELFKSWSVMPILVCRFTAREVRKNKIVALHRLELDWSPWLLEAPLPYGLAIAIEDDSALAGFRIRPCSPGLRTIPVGLRHIVVAIVHEIHHRASIDGGSAVRKHLEPLIGKNLKFLFKTVVRKISAGKNAIHLPRIKLAQSLFKIRLFPRCNHMDVGKRTETHSFLAEIHLQRGRTDFRGDSGECTRRTNETSSLHIHIPFSLLLIIQYFHLE